MKIETGATQTYYQIRDSIIRTELAPGITLSENDLMERFQVGRTPLRDALQRLGHEGLVEIIPRRGTIVTQVTLRDLQQIFEVRSGLEDIVAQLATERRTDDQLHAIRALCEISKRGDPDTESDVDLDASLHTLLLESSQNELLSKLYMRVSDASLRLLYLTKCGMESKKEQQEFFHQVYDALHMRNENRLKEVLREHIQSFRDRIQAAVF